MVKSLVLPPAPQVQSMKRGPCFCIRHERLYRAATPATCSGQHAGLHVCKWCESPLTFRGFGRVELKGEERQGLVFLVLLGISENLRNLRHCLDEKEVLSTHDHGTQGRQRLGSSETH